MSHCNNLDTALTTTPLLPPELLPADRVQPAEGAAEAAGQPEQLPQQPDGRPAETHWLTAGAEHQPAHTDGQTTGGGSAVYCRVVLSQY